MYGVIYTKNAMIRTKKFNTVKERVQFVKRFIKKYGSMDDGHDNYIMYFIDGNILRPKFSFTYIDNK